MDTSPSPEPPAPQRRILVCYDGSRHAEAAIATAADLFPGAEAEVLCVATYGWSLVAAPGGPASPILPSYGMDGGVGDVFIAATRKHAVEVAEAGAREARRLGLDARPVAELTVSSIWHEIVRRAESGDHAAVVLGSRGRSAIRTALLGGVTAGVTAHCTVPVLVVHAPSLPSRDTEPDEEDVSYDPHVEMS